MPRTVDPTTGLRRALKRLRGSDTPLKRKNARNFVAAECNAILADMDKVYPKLRPDGTAIIRRRTKGAYCPLCKTPLKTAAILVQHFNTHHPKMLWGDGIVPERPSRVAAGHDTTQAYRCVCGYRGAATPMAKHLQAFKDLGNHLAKASMRQSVRSLAGKK